MTLYCALLAAPNDENPTKISLIDVFPINEFFRAIFYLGPKDPKYM